MSYEIYDKCHIDFRGGFAYNIDNQGTRREKNGRELGGRLRERDGRVRG